jgi:hypothetical protein
MDTWTADHLNNQTPTIVNPLRRITHPKFKWRDPSKTDVTRTWRKARLLLRLNGEAYESRARVQLPAGH